MKTITKALRTFWDVFVGFIIGVLLALVSLLTLFAFGVTDKKIRHDVLKMFDDNDDDDTYTRKKKESE